MSSGEGSQSEIVLRRAIRPATRIWCRVAVALRLDLTVEGRELVPASAPVLLVCRHFHHQWDGMILLAVCQRFVSFLVALDWVRNRGERFILAQALRLLGWPAILRPDSLALRQHCVFQPVEVRRYLHRGVQETVRLLQAGEIVAVFPEGYPNVDTVYTPKRGDEEFLPFRAGFIRLVELAQLDGLTRVAIVPTGFAYQRGKRWRVSLRFGEPLALAPGVDQRALLMKVEEQVRVLSRNSAL